MKRAITLLVILLVCQPILWAHTTPAEAAIQNNKLAASAHSAINPICLPGIYLDDPVDCQPVGPSAYLTEMAQKGVTFPLTQLPISKPDFELTYVERRYGQIRTANAPVFGSVEDAMTGNKGKAIMRIDSPFSYISYTDEAVIDGKRFYMIDAGQWMTANDVIRLGSVPLFQGITFHRTPDRGFGWVLTYLSNGPVFTKQTPGYKGEDYTDHALNNHEVVQVYATQMVGDEEWNMVGPDEWIPHRVLARVTPDTSPPAGVTGGRWIDVNLYEQTLAVYQDNQLVFATLIASGLEPFWTRPGLFQITQKLDTTPMRGSFEVDHSDAYYLEDVPWTMYFDQARALHGAYWRANLGFPQSHGCVNLSVGDSHWLYDWAQQGDWVYVWDPSGKTPTDPGLYGSGGY